MPPPTLVGGESSYRGTGVFLSSSGTLLWPLSSPAEVAIGSSSLPLISAGRHRFSVSPSDLGRSPRDLCRGRLGKLEPPPPLPLPATDAAGPLSRNRGPEAHRRRWSSPSPLMPQSL